MFERVTIIGVGLLGASLGLAVKQRRLARHVVGVGRSGSSSLDIAKERGAIDEASHEVIAAAASDLVVLCTPIRQFPGMFSQLAAALPPGAIVTDVGSTKAQVMTWARERLGSAQQRGVVFVGSHPMAGSEKRGPEHARSDLYQGALCLLCTEPSFLQDAVCPTPSGSAAAATFRALEKIEALWKALGMTTLRLPPAEHDRWVATISHLPHAVAFSLVNAVGAHPEALPAIAGGFLDSTRIASSDVDLWTDIFLTNRLPIANAIGELQDQLAELRLAIMSGNEAAIRTTLEKAKGLRDKIAVQRRR